MYNLYLAVWEITSKCNLNCLHCMSRGENTQRGEDLSTEEGIKLLEDLAELQCEVVVLSGGEPFIRQDWVVFAQKIRDLRMSLAIISNGYAINDDTIDLLYYLSPGSIAISLDGCKDETHDRIRGKEGVFNHLIPVIKKMRQRNIPVSIATTVNKDNYNELDSILQIVLETGAVAWQIQIAKPRGRMPVDLVIDEKEYYRLAETIVDYRKKYNDKVRIIEADCIGYYSKLTPDLEIKEWFGCQCGIQSLCIQSDGGVKGCIAMQDAEANIRETPLKEIWNNNSMFAYNRRFIPAMLKGYCQKCKYGNLCRGGCSENATSLRGTEKETPYCLYKIETEGYN